MDERTFELTKETEKVDNGFFKGLLRRFSNKRASVEQKQSVHAQNVSGSVLQAGRDINLHISADTALLEQIRKLGMQGNEALVPLLEDKADECKQAILRNDLDKARKICESLCIITYEDCPDYLHSKFKYYRYLLSLMTAEKCEVQEQCRVVIQEDYADRAEFLFELSKDPEKCDLNDLLTRSEEDQVCALTILFNSGLSQRILEKYDNFEDESNGEMPFFWKYFVGLSLFNAQRFEESASVLHQTVEGREYTGLIRHDSIIIYAYLAELQEVTRGLSVGCGTKEKLKKTYNEYIDQKNKCDYADAIRGQELLVAEVELQTVLNISIDDFWTVYSSYSPEIQNDPQVVNLLGTYYELKGDYQNVYDTYSQLDWKHEELYLFKRMYSKLAVSEFDEILRLYEEAASSARSARVQGLWLCGLSELYPERFEVGFKTLLEEAGDDYEAVLALTLSIKIEERSLFEEYVYPKVEVLMANILEAPDNVKVGYAGMLVRFGHGEDALKILKCIAHAHIIDDQLGMELYRNLYIYKDWDYEEKDSSDDGKVESFVADAVTIKEAIADWFIEKEIVKANFMTIKINCLYERGKILSAIETSKELYEITKDASVAANIISLLSQIRTSTKGDYEKFADILKDSDNLRCLMASAVAYEEIGRYDEAGFQVYKALYKLNGEDDYEVFDSCFGLYNRMMAYHNDDVNEKDRVDANVVVTLKETLEIDGKRSIYSEEGEILNICLDSESFIADYGEGRNRSMGIEHFGPKDTLYQWLYGKKIGDQVTYNGKRYGIVEIIDRYFYIGKYIFSKIVDSNSKSKIPVRTIKIENIESLKKELLDIYKSERGLRGYEHTKNLRDMYHHRNSETGIPIESLNSCDYTEYIDIIRELLYVPDQALYAGEVKLYDGYDGDYVLSLPSLAIICVLSYEGLFDGMKDQLVIPDSLKTFIQKQISDNTDTLQISPGKLIAMEDGSMMMLSKDADVIDIWRRMYAFCDGVRTVDVSDEERSAFKFVSDVDAERFFSKMKYDMCQLDAFILAKKNSFVLIMDDLFFRMLAECSGIYTTNSTFVLFNQDTDDIYEVAERLSKTNYIFTPILYKDTKSGVRFWNNLLKASCGN